MGRDINFAQLIKIYGNEGQTKTDSCCYSPSEYTGSEKRVITGNPDIENISTSYVERQNLTMRMHMRRFTRLKRNMAYAKSTLADKPGDLFSTPTDNKSGNYKKHLKISYMDKIYYHHLKIINYVFP